MLSFDPAKLPFTRPAPQVKAVNLPDVPKSIIDGMAKYEDAARTFSTQGFETDYVDAHGDHIPGGIIVEHRPADAGVTQIFRIPKDHRSTKLERLTFFDLGGGNRIQQILPVSGDDWRGVWRPGGLITGMDLNGNESFQLWRYWEDRSMKEPFPLIKGELDNKPGPGRFERLTHDEYRYQYIMISRSQNYMVFSSNKENNQDSLVYIAPLKGLKTGARADSVPFTLPSRLVTPLRQASEKKGTDRWMTQDISLDDSRLLIINGLSASDRPLYIVDLTTNPPRAPERILIDQFLSPEYEVSVDAARFSLNPDTPNLIYINTDAFGDFSSVVAYDLEAKTVLHITTSGPEFTTLRPIPWDVCDMRVTPDALYFVANADGWYLLHVVPLTGEHRHKVIEVRLEGWEGGGIVPYSNEMNNSSFELILQLTSHRNPESLASLDLKSALETIQIDADGRKYVDAQWTPYGQAQAAAPTYATPAPKLLRFPSFDGLEVPVMYYRPEGKKGPLPLLIQIHGGPASQVTSFASIPIHGYILNELGCAMMYPNVRGSVGCGKRYMAADDVEKREDSVKDIGALLDYIKDNMKDEIQPEKVAVIGNSYGGYMVLACLTSFSFKLTCGLVNYGIAHWPSFLRNTAPQRRDNRRREYGDERDPKILAFLERISPRNNAAKISVPLQIAHGETDARVPVDEAYLMYDVLSRGTNEGGAGCELMVCEKEGHGFKQKSVIEFTNAAKIHFVQRHLLGFSSC